ncbi:dipeptidase [Ferroacidibacillus organovorans]|uniref:Membrane dipeptidase n=1 Tax=Ferroacidibacillus organovorans TaxID=1765683 RepID=A0A853K9A5_9BACL|nr:dipeptidase [Ferroacidibacillus organovorans]KYP82161.1 hypothetical protein AYJ22_00465 [Ferroacidibacillus organovorans]OAG93595.1 hypothetical protein AYW79_09920 [Ferroacidibacillus organovorans]
MFQGNRVVDGHADILYRMGHDHLSFGDPDSGLHQSYEKLKASGVDLQVFVTFVEPALSSGEQLYEVFASLKRFYDEVVPKGISPVLSAADIARLRESDSNPIFGLLSVEGAECLDRRISVLDGLYRMGVRLVGLTWNGQNCLADGVGESRGGGLTQFGFEVVQRMNQLGMVIDVSHLSVQGVWDVLETSSAPVIASHSNAMRVHAHRRNLTDDQIRAIARSGGLIGATFVPPFLAEKDASIDDVMRHIDHLLTIAGEDAVGLGSDFDGIDEGPVGLRDGRSYPVLLERLYRTYGDPVAKKIAGESWLRVLETVLR